MRGENDQKNKPNCPAEKGVKVQGVGLREGQDDDDEAERVGG